MHFIKKQRGKDMNRTQDQIETEWQEVQAGWGAK
jgi:hypothetical protein